MKTIVAATDFTPVSVNAVLYAADFAKVIGAELSIVHIYPMPLSFGEIAPIDLNQKDMFDELKQKLEQLKEKITARTSGKIKIITELIAGDVESSIKNYCKTVLPYAVVVGAESGNAYERFLFGAKTIDLMRKVDFPLIVVPQDSKFSMISRIGLACDLKDTVETLPVEEIKKLVKEFHAELHILHVSNEKISEFDAAKITESGNVQEMLLPLNPVYDFIQGSDAEEEILKFAEKKNLDLLIVVPKYDDLVYRIFQKSHSRRIVLHAHLPVLSVHE
ncbi:MAG: universal stress protein [Bacteroidetes bacterium]|nr:universal stress protein [Bacteroidota bacterium]MBS1934044.1 universal stress protein [Bacteroidota bacterium]